MRSEKRSTKSSGFLAIREDAFEHDDRGLLHDIAYFRLKVVTERPDELGAVPAQLGDIDRHVVPALVVFADEPKQLLSVFVLGFHFDLRFGLPSPASAARPASASWVAS